MEKEDINNRIIQKIKKSGLDENMKIFINEIIKFEIDEGKFSNRYSKVYEELIADTVISLKKK